MHVVRYCIKDWDVSLVASPEHLNDACLWTLTDRQLIYHVIMVVRDPPSSPIKEPINSNVFGSFPNLKIRFETHFRVFFKDVCAELLSSGCSNCPFLIHITKQLTKVAVLIVKSIYHRNTRTSF